MNIKTSQSKRYGDAVAVAKALPNYFTKQAIREISDAVKNEILFTSVIDDSVVGFITVRIENPAVLELTWMGVLPHYQSKGIGTKLLSEVFNQLGDEFNYIYIKTLDESAQDEGYTKTRRFWTKSGFTKIITIDPFPGWDEGNPCVIMVKSMPSTVK
jgi:GNAT superfamily N-acetyltransferase